ncbi:LppM family (lipo)protein [Actinomyces oris]|uniref:LppM family (lipo)protein n=1 Tax=Actinomyces oris TaxID=544580 RepID=UPI002889ACE4|nr:viral protein TPX [Actinomyces oris]
MPHVTVRRSSTQRSALASLVALTVFAALALIGTPASSLPTADDDIDFSISSDIVIKEDDTLSVKLTMTDSGSIPVLRKSTCNKDSSKPSGSSFDDFKVKFAEKDGTRTCTMEGTGPISESSENIKHEGDEYIVQTLNFDSIDDDSSADISQSVTFPGKVTQADGGTVEGTKVSFKDNDKHEVKGKDKPAKSAAAGSSKDGAGEDDSGSIPVWVWILIGSLAVAIVGGVVGMLVIMQRRKKQPQLAAYAAAAQVYDPNQALLGQPMQQPFQSGYAEPAAQPYQQSQPYQPGYADPATQPYQQGQQPYQPGYAEPAAQPYQQGQPYQPGYADPATQPYQQAQPYQPPYNHQPGQPGQRF